MIVDDLIFLRDAYMALRFNGVLTSQAEFSRRFLLRNQSYLRSMWCRQRRPGPAVMAQLEWSLRQEIISYKRNPHLGQAYAVHLNAANACLVEQHDRIRFYRQQRLGFASAVADNDNLHVSPIPPVARRSYQQ